MIRVLAAFVAAFGLAAGLGAVTASCSGDSCDCPETPALPDAQAALPITQAWGTEGADLAAPPVDPTGGTLEITGETVVLHYNDGGAEHEVVYDVLGPG